MKKFIALIACDSEGDTFNYLINIDHIICVVETKLGCEFHLMNRSIVTSNYNIGEIIKKIKAAEL